MKNPEQDLEVMITVNLTVRGFTEPLPINFRAKVSSKWEHALDYTIRGIESMVITRIKEDEK